MSYLHDEQRAIAAFALGVFSDPSASIADRSAAHARLLRDDRKPDLKLLTTAELTLMVNCGRTFKALLMKMRGEPHEVPELVPPPFVPTRPDALTHEPTHFPAAPELVTPSEPAPLTHTFVGSSNIASATLDGGGLLRVSFVNGGSYAYSGVSVAEWQAWLAADSAGSHFAKQIRPHHPVSPEPLTPSEPAPLTAIPLPGLTLSKVYTLAELVTPRR